VDVSEANIPDWSTLNGEALSESQVRIIVLLALFFELFGGACVISHQLFLWAGFQMISPALSNTLPDNILVRDVLGRNYSLPTAIFSDWPVLVAMLHSQFKDCPGLLNVKSGKFSMTDEDDPELPVGPANWAAVAVRRKRFKMAVIMSQLQMSNQLCAKCGAGVRTMSASTSACPRCGIFYRSSRTYRKRLLAKDIRRQQRCFGNGDGLLHVPKADLRFDFESSNDLMSKDRYMMALWFEKEITWNHTLSIEPPGDSRQSPQLLVSEAPLINATTASATPINSDDGMDKNLNRPNQEDDSNDEGPNPESAAELEEERTAARLRELEEIRHFNCICIRLDGRLHDAALKGDMQLLEALTIKGINVDRDCGAWGTALVAAIMSCSDKAVTFLLDAGANPLSQVGPINGPVLAATRFGTEFALRAVLAKVSSRQSKSKLYQEVIDKALFAALDDGRLEQTDALLYAGANPFFRVADERSAFSISVGLGNGALNENFLAQAWGRGLLTDIETRYITAAPRMNPLPVLSDTWIDTCCLNIQIRRTQMVEKRIASRLVQKTTFSLLIPLWRHRGPPPIRTEWDQHHPCLSHNEGDLLQPRLPQVYIQLPP
jgi:predicted RNA-binding Zn-ribbon protein involved in translation (DUF1610 family)